MGAGCAGLCRYRVWGVRVLVGVSACGVKLFGEGCYRFYAGGW